MDLEIRRFLTKAETQKDADALKKAYDLINEGTKENALSGGRCFCHELYVLCAEQAFQLGLSEIAETCLMMYFKGKPPTNQFLCRAYLCQGQLCAQTLESMDDAEKAVMHFLKAIEISKEQPRYHFIVFNASVLYLQTIRPFLRPGSRPDLHASLTQVLRALEEVGETDYHWRAELMLLLIECLVEAGKVKEAANWGRVTADFIGVHTPDLYPRIFSLQVQHKLLDLTRGPKKAEESLTLSVIYKMQKLKHQVGGASRRDDTAKLKEIFLLLMTTTAVQHPGVAQGLTPVLEDSKLSITPRERASFLLELGHLALQLNIPQITSDCLGELKKTALSDVGHRIAVECLKCEQELHKRGPKIEEYKRSDVEAQQKLVWRLDQLLQNAVRAGGVGTVQGVCATLWNACLPLLQHNLRRSIRKPLLRLVKVLEESNSTLLDLRCQVHSEVGVMEAEEDRVESAVEHVQKALQLDTSGEHQERLTTTLHTLYLRTLLYETPERSEDRAALLIQQARTASSRGSRRNVRPMLVNAGVGLAPDDFQTVLDADNAPKVASGTHGVNVVSQLATKARHHIACVQRAEEYLKRQEGKRNPERVRLWAELVKTARKLEAWSVCRAACRFCVLYDDNCRETPDINGENKEGECPTDPHRRERYISAPERDLLRLLAEVHFINAEATVQKLRSEGVPLNGTAVLPPQRGKQPAEGASSQLEDDPLWTTYRDWVQNLSVYATANFLRAAELGVELGEAWIVSNAAVYLWNYNSHVLASGEQRRLLATFQKLIDLLKQTGHAGQVQLLVLLCNVVAQGLIQPWIPPASGAEGLDTDQTQPSRARKGAEKGGSIQGQLLEPEAVQDVRKALELCEYALRLTSGSMSADSASVAARKQMIATWVRTKQLLQQQIGQKLDFEEESKTTEMAMWRALVGVEMLVCNSSCRLMEFSAPSREELVKMASECLWTDPLVELQVWTHLAHFCHQADEQELVMTCSQNALKLESFALKKAKVASLALCNNKQVYEMLSSVACLRGLGLVQSSKGHPDQYRAGLHTLQSSISYAEKAGSQTLCMQGARHYWNSCLPLMCTPQERQQLQNSIEMILRAMASTSSRDGKDEGSKVPVKRTSGSFAGAGSPCLEISGGVRPDNDLTLRAAFYGLLFCIHGDRNDWRAGLHVLDQAVREMPRTRHRLPLFKQRAVARARLGESLLVDMQRFGDEGEECLSRMWHYMAHSSTAPEHKLACYQNAITSLQSPSSRWQKVEYLLEFGEWLYCTHFPMADALHPIRWAEDILLHIQAGDQQDHDSGSEISMQKDKEELKAPLTEEAELIPVKCEPQVGVKSAAPSLTLSDLRDVQQLEGLFRVHTLLAAMTSGTTPHLQHCLLAYTCILRIWQVSLGAAGEVVTEVTDSQLLPPQAPASAKRDKGKKSKEATQLAAEEKPKRKVPVQVPADVLPTGPEDWAGYDCPTEVRQAFRHDRSTRTINQQSISKQTQTLYFLDLLLKELNSYGLTHLTLPVLHLAEVIAHDLMDSKSVSDLYRLRIAKACSQLRLKVSHHKKHAGPTYIYEEERMRCWEALAVLREGTSCDISPENSSAPEAMIGCVDPVVRKLSRQCTQGIWIEKAEILLGLGQYQSARELLAEAHLFAKKVGDRTSQAKSLLLLAELANQERHHDQALALLREAQSIGGGEDFWYHVTLCMVKAIMDGGGQGKETQACHILEHGSTVLQSVLQERPNRGPVLGSLVASLETRRAILKMKSLKISTSDPELLKTLKAACDTHRQAAEKFFQLGQQEQGAQALLEQAQTLRILAKHADSKEVQRRHLLDSYFLMHQAVSTQQEVALTAMSLLPAQLNQTLSLPAVRKLVSLRLDLVELVTDMLVLVCREQKEWERLQERRGSVERTVEAFLQGSPDLTSLEQEWQSLSQILGQVAITQLQTAIGASRNCVEDRARSLSMLGKCLHLLAVQRNPLSPSTQWNIPNATPTHLDTADPETVQDGMEEEPTASSLREQEVEQGDIHEPRVTDQRQSMSTSAKLQGRWEAARQLLAQASETLAQAVSLCLQHQLTHILPTVCLTAVECHGQFDPSSAGQYLALYQSSVCCGQMAEVLRAACIDSSESQFSALLNLHTNLQATAQSGELASSLLGPTKDRLNGLSKAYMHLSINPNHLNILGELPSTFNILLLQHSEDGSALYGAFFEKAKPADSQKGKGPHPSAGTLDCSRVAKINVCPETLSGLRERARSFKQESTRVLAREGYQSGGEWSVAREGAVAKCHTMKSHQRNVQNEIASNFNSLVQDMEGYLHPLLSQFALPWVRGWAHSTLLTESTKPSEKEERSASDKLRSPVDSGVSVVLLPDRMLIDLPLEALGILLEEGVGSVSRDFCLQLLHARLQKDEPVESESKKEPRGGKAGKARGDQSKAFKGVTVNRVLPPESLPVDMHNFKYVIDPYNEVGDTERGGPVQGMRRILEAYGQQTGPLWDGILSPEHAPSLDELEHLVTNCSAFIFNGTEHFLAHIPPSKVISMKLSDCQMVMLFDLVHTSNSALRQTKLDALKSPGQLALEEPLETAALLSLGGVQTVTLNQWHSTFQQNTHDMDAMLESMLKMGMASGQAVHALRQGAARSCAVSEEGTESGDDCSKESVVPESPERPGGRSHSTSPCVFNHVIYGLPNLVVT